MSSAVSQGSSHRSISLATDNPEGWFTTKLSAVCEINPPKAPKDALPASEPVTFVPMPAVDERLGAITNARTESFATVRKGYTSFRESDVIMAKITPCMENGKAAIARGLINGLGFGSTEFHVLRSTGAVLPDFIYHFVRQESFRRAAEAEMTGSVGQKRVPLAFLEDAEFPLPPLVEQKRIVTMIAEVLARMNATRERLGNVPLILKRFRQAVLAAACSGRLTEEWREANRGSLENWQHAELSDICVTISDGDHQPPPKQRSGIPFLTIGNISSGWLNFSETRFVSERYFADIKSERKPQKGDVLYTVVGATIGIPVRVDFDRPFCFQRHIALLRPSKATTPEFLWTVMASPETYKQAWAHITGTAQPTLPLGNLRRMPVHVPPLTEQKEIVRRVEAVFALADAIEKRVAAATARTDKLTQSILTKAFRGELVPTEAELAGREGRDYEPASVLLERIRKEREASQQRGGPVCQKRQNPRAQSAAAK